MESTAISAMLNNPVWLKRHMRRTLHETAFRAAPFTHEPVNTATDSSVLFLLGNGCECENGPAPCLILNKRSLLVKQPGDLCCPGGRVSSRWDQRLARILMLPLTPLTCWPFWKKWKRYRPARAQEIALHFAAGLREGFEEMRLNPLGVRFLGTLPAQRLVMFNRLIYPSVAWVQRQKRFMLNWEVEKIVYIPLRALLNPRGYARYRLRFNMTHPLRRNAQINDFPCFVHRNQREIELLWGATYRITIHFLQIVFGFSPPDMTSLPVYHGSLEPGYLTGNGPTALRHPSPSKQ